MGLLLSINKDVRIYYSKLYLTKQDCDTIYKACSVLNEKEIRSIVQNLPYSNISLSYYAARNNYIGMLQYLKSTNKLELTAEMCSQAARYGNLETIKWLINNNCEWNSWTAAYAALNGHLHILLWLDQNTKIQWNRWLEWGSGILYNGNWSWLHDWDLLDNFSVSTYAVLGGHLDILKWLNNHGSPTNYRLLEYADKLDHNDITEWIKQTNPKFYNSWKSNSKSAAWPA